jgi:diguanylate cyclase (GGDEF)-like protein
VAVVGVLASARRRDAPGGSAAERAWLDRFGADAPTAAGELLALTCGGDADEPELRRAAQAIGVVRAHAGMSVATLVEDMSALRTALGVRPATVDLLVVAATSAYVDEVTTILAARATRDPLTGLPNRAALVEALEREVGGSSRASRPPALLLIDLDGFKGVNDTDGHLAGDAVLAEVAAVLRGHIRAGDLPCRLGGDEFAVLLPRTSRPQAVAVARRLLTAARSSSGLSTKSAHVSFSVGVGWLPSPRHPDELVAVADAAMYTAKAAGGDGVHVGAAG